MGLGVGLLASPAFAGHWELAPESFNSNEDYISASGNMLYKDDNNPWAPVNPITTLDVGRGNDGFGPFVIMSGSGQFEPSSGWGNILGTGISGQATTTFVWVRDLWLPNTPPQEVAIREEARGLVWAAPYGPNDYTLNIGVEATEHPSAPVGGRAKERYSLKAYPVSDGKVTITRNFDVKIEGDTRNEIGAEFVYSVSIDPNNRTLSVTRDRPSGSSPVKIQGIDTIDEDHDEWVDEDGNGHGQGRWSYYDRQIVASQIRDDPHDVLETFKAVRGGQWSSGATYTWEPSAASDTQNSHTQATPQGGGIYNENGARPSNTSVFPENDPEFIGWTNEPTTESELKIKHTATDADGVKADSEYTLKLHNEWEHPEEDSSKSYNDGITNHPGQTVSPWESIALSFNPGLVTNDPEAEWSIEEAGSVSVKFSTGFDGNFNFKDWLKIQVGASTEAQLELKASYKASAAKPKDLFPGAPVGTVYRPVLQYRKVTNWKLVDHYLPSGWDKNPATSSGKWSQHAEGEVVDILPSWVKVPSSQAPLTGQASYPDYSDSLNWAPSQNLTSTPSGGDS